jgi:hypothetical protein
MDIRNELENLLESETLQSLRYWLDHNPGRLLADRRAAAKLALYTLIVLVTWDRRESRPIIWTLPRLIERVKEYLRSQPEDADLENAKTLLDFAARQVVLELSERRLLFLLASATGQLTLDDLDAATFIVKTWGRAEIQDYGEFLRLVCEAQRLDMEKD